MNAITRFILNPYSVYNDKDVNKEQNKAKKARTARKKAQNHKRRRK